MQEISITDNMFIDAREQSIKLGKLKNSIRNGDGNLIGFLGEYITNNILCGTLTNTYDYDIILNDIKIDVKTKATTVKPLDTYECSIAEFNCKQECDVYVFTRILKNYEKGWVLGWLPTDLYYKKAVFLKKGEIDPSNNYTVKANCFNVKINELFKIKDLLNYKR
jgi:hypothetical protein